MSNTKQKLGLVVAALASISVLAVAPVYAHEGTSDLAKPVSTEVGTVSNDSTRKSSLVTTEPTTTTEGSDDSTGDVGTLRARAKQQLETQRAGKTKHTVVARQKACQAREKNLNTKITNFGSHATKQLTRLDAVYAKLQAYQADKKLTVADYDTLIAAANAKQTSATEAVAALTAVTVKIDCTSTDPAESVVTVKTAVTNARIALHNYHIAIKDVLVALMTAKSTDATTTTTDTTTEDTTNAQ